MNAVVLFTSITIVSGYLADAGNFLVLPITTDLQRTLLGRPGEPARDARAYVLINGEAVMSTDGTINAKALDLAAMRKELEPYADRSKGGVHFSVCYRPIQTARQEEFLLWTLYGFAVHSGFRDARMGNSYIPNFEWESHIAKVNESAAGEPDGDEQAIGNELVRVFPVRTILSRYLASNADCIVQVLQPFGPASLPTDTRLAIQEFVSKVKVRKKAVLQVKVWSKQEGRQAADEFLSKGGAQELAESLGYETGVVSHRPR